MMIERQFSNGSMNNKTQKKPDPAAQRALAEAQERRAQDSDLKLQTELNGRKGPEPTRFGDWEKKGIISDF